MTGLSSTNKLIDVMGVERVRMRIIGPAVSFFCLFAAIGLAQDVYVYTVDTTEAHAQLVSNSPYITLSPKAQLCVIFHAYLN